MKQWYLVQFKPNSNHLAVRNLQRQGFKTFLPLQEMTSRKATRFVASLKPLFPGYMFVSFHEKATPWRKINSTIGVSQLVSFDGRPKALPGQLISSLMLRCDASGKFLPEKSLNAGDHVEITTGPFANFAATVETIDAQQRVCVLLELMGQSTRLHIAPDQCQRYCQVV